MFTCDQINRYIFVSQTCFSERAAQTPPETAFIASDKFEKNIKICVRGLSRNLLTPGDSHPQGALAVKKNIRKTWLTFAFCFLKPGQNALE